ncbi:MAG: hypothetical protein R3C28_28395 [Pirellulaceae bacterium]
MFADAGAGRVYVIYGSGRPTELPAGRLETTLANREIPRGGLYLVEEPDRQAWEYFGADDTLISASNSVSAGNLRAGMSLHNAASDSGYVMYTAESVHTRFVNLEGQSLLPKDSSDHFLIVRYSAGSWQYSDGVQWINFNFASSDTLVAEVLFDTHSVTALPYATQRIHGIRPGVLGGDLGFFADSDAGNPNPGRYSVTGTTFDLPGIERWYTFTFQGDGQIGDYIKIRTDTGINRPISRPAGRASTRLIRMQPH